MSQETIISGIVAVLTVALGAPGFWALLQTRRKAAVTAQDEKAVDAAQTERMALTTAHSAQTLATALAGDLEAVRKALDRESRARQELDARFREVTGHQEEQIQDLEERVSRLRTALRIFSAAWDDLINRWPEWRAQETPPPKPHTDI